MNEVNSAAFDSRPTESRAPKLEAHAHHPQQQKGGMPSHRQPQKGDKRHGQSRHPTCQMRRACGSGPGAGLLAAKPRDLERFIDNKNHHSSSNISSRHSYRGWGGGVDGRPCKTAASAVSYEPSISWDGLALDPRPFARFDEHNTLALTKKPVGSAGVRVIELEGHKPGGIFGRPATEPGRMQWTVEQETTRVLVPDNPFAEATARGGSVVVKRPYFNSTVALVPKVEASRPPTCMPRAGPQGDGALLSPEERRMINDYEAKMQSAMRVGRKARYQKTRLDFIMRHRYPEGSVGVDSPFNPTSEVYAERRSLREAKEMASCAKAAARWKRLDEIRGKPHARFGYNPWHHPDPPARGGAQHGVFGGAATAIGGVGGGGSGCSRAVTCEPIAGNGGEHFMQAKARKRKAGQEERMRPAGRDPANSDGGGGGAQCERRSSTFINILGGRERVSKSDPRIRSQLLWDEGAGRRNYDVVSGARLPLPTEAAERPPGRLAHPSQQSLERGRNLQGSLTAA